MKNSARSMRHAALTIRSASNTTTPQSSAYPSAYPTEDEDDAPTKRRRKPFPFLKLPSELRNRVYAIAFESVPTVIDLDPEIFHLLRQRLALFFVSKQIHDEVLHYFYATRTFRVFPIYPGRYFKTKKPLLARLAPSYRASITSLQLRLGPGWNNPPKGWVVNDALGLKDCKSVRVLNIFVECDPSDAIFKGFRQGDGFYETFSCGLLEGILKEVPSIEAVEFDAWTSVKKDGDMMIGLLETVVMNNKIVKWGPERGWDKVDERDELVDQSLARAGIGSVVSRSLAVLA
ncbi:hypothetical protein BP6252_03844 [Coleophoma cylindrospora]|uniref:Uncharacterized protein n=1 Tax=Coleophoma cylindrospora TaxID=1849047 RepID=A0A3D8S8Q6_9HELO|nr:hypothetical protein BP6252_03844 [Coleophoma cylindrospora]